MVILEIDNSYSSIKGLTAKQEKSLKTELSYVIGGKSGYFSKYGPKKRSLLGRKGDFPSGLYNRVVIWLITNKISFRINDLRVKP
jgi:hypothetical protein